MLMTKNVYKCGTHTHAYARTHVRTLTRRITRTHTHAPVEKTTERQTDGQTDRQTQTGTDPHTDRQTQRQIDTDGREVGKGGIQLDPNTHTEPRTRHHCSVRRLRRGCLLLQGAPAAALEGAQEGVYEAAQQ